MGRGSAVARMRRTGYVIYLRLLVQTAGHGRALLARAIAGVAIALMLLAAVIPWLDVPLIQAYRPWAFPLDLGWGVRVRIGAFTYGLLCLLVVGFCVGRMVLAGDRRQRRWPRWRARPLHGRTFALMGGLMAGVSLLFILQFTTVDFRLVTQLADQETQSLLIKAHLGYALPRQHFPYWAFGFDFATVIQRMALLIELASAGVILPLVSGLLCLYAAYLGRGAAVVGAPQMAAVATRPRARPSSRGVWRWLWVAAAAVGLVILARAPMGILLQYAGKTALSEGDYSAALDFFAKAQALDPNLSALPAYREARGKALYELAFRDTPDATIYLTSQYLDLGDFTDAWQQSAGLLQKYPADSVVRYQVATSLEMYVAYFDRNYLTPVEDQVAYNRPQSLLGLPTLEAGLPWLERLIQLQPNNVFAYYTHGRMLFTSHAYEFAQRDFEAVIRLTSDNDMRSTAYTYIALSRAGMGDYVGERAMLSKALALDTGFYNTTARQAASGLH